MAHGFVFLCLEIVHIFPSMTVFAGKIHGALCALIIMSLALCQELIGRDRWHAPAAPKEQPPRKLSGKRTDRIIEL